MRIDLSPTPHRSTDLLRFLRHMGYVATEVGHGAVEVDDHLLPKSAFGVAAMSLALRLQVWNALNSAEARLVLATGPLEP